MSIRISVDTYIDLCDKRRNALAEHKHEVSDSAWELAMDLIRQLDDGDDSEHDPMQDVDNLIFNAEICERSEFSPNGEYSNKYNEYVDLEDINREDFDTDEEYEEAVKEAEEEGWESFCNYEGLTYNNDTVIISW